ncbi:MAG: GGDEF domain-containing protein [Pseudohongiella sp.]|uniref:diguanylate cyclase domain-containing protein n=1 Tax=Pseudohongiella sp. TaxID=1979412 RepID=UPI0034A05E1E
MREPTNQSRHTDPIQQIRGKRIGQGILVMLLAVSALSLVNFFDNQSVVVASLLFTMVFLLLALLLLRKGHAQSAAALTVVVMFVCVAQAMWGGAGLRSSALTGYPAVLLFAMIMLGKRTFYIALAAMAAYMIILIYATQNGWRVGTEEPMGYRWLGDYGVILIAAAFIIRVLASDLLALLDALHIQMDDATQSRLQAEHLANHDNLTGLPNRRMAEHYFKELLRLSEQEDAGVGLVFVDIDNFKIINDSHGHHLGDELLCHLGETIGSQLRKSDRLVRIAGDEFLILLPGIAKAKDVEYILEKINHAISLPITLQGETLVPAVSMGVALAPQHGQDFKDLMGKADLAMYQAKADGRNQYQFYRPA